MIRFSNVNRVNSQDHNPNYQRHHLIPQQAISELKLNETFQTLADNGFDLDDFHQNGILLPCREKEAIRSGRPLHRGPHPRYNELVIERLVRIWKLSRNIENDHNRLNFLRFRTILLQRSLRVGLAGNRFVRLHLNSRDPLRSTANFSDIDSRIDRLYRKTKSTVSRRANFLLKSGVCSNVYLAEI